MFIAFRTTTSDYFFPPIISKHKQSTSNICTNHLKDYYFEIVGEKMIKNIVASGSPAMTFNILFLTAGILIKLEFHM